MRNLITKIYYPATNTHVWFRNGRRLKTMDKKFETVLRSGKTIDMLAEIEILQEAYYRDLQASIDSFDTYTEVSEETRNDLIKVRAVLSTFELLGYIDNSECEAMFQAASEQRESILRGLSDEKFNN